MEFNYEIDSKTLTEYGKLAETDILPKVKTVEDIAQDIARRIILRWEEIQVERATNKQLLNAKKTIEEELERRKPCHIVSHNVT